MSALAVLRPQHAAVGTKSYMRCIWLAFMGANALRVPLPHLRAQRGEGPLKPLHRPLVPDAAVLHDGTTADAAAIASNHTDGLKAILRTHPSRSLRLLHFISTRYCGTRRTCWWSPGSRAPRSSPSLKTCVNLPGAIAFTVLYGSL